MQPFVINSHGRMVFPANFLPELDFTVITDLDHLAAVIRRDFEAKAPSGTDILRRVEEGGHYSSRYELMRDVALNLFWTNRFAMTMYDKRPTRWRDVPRHRDDVYLPLLTPWQDAERKVAAVERQYAALPRRGTAPSRTASSRCCSTSCATGASTPPSCRSCYSPGSRGRGWGPCRSKLTSISWKVLRRCARA
jgi:hypothetical protein